MSEKEFVLGEISKKFNLIVHEIITVLEKQGQEYEKYVRNIKEELEKLKNEELIKVCFVGQYSAGKSTIISALTGREDIKIDSDITTNMATTYKWNDIILVDTPGLFTDREDHDEITYNAIRTSDLLIFTITSDLFDQIILDNFIKLAYENNYRNKMLLIINKMSMEAGDSHLLISSYKDSLEKSLHPYSLSDFDLSFIDAADYIEGLEIDEPELIEASNFMSFIDSLNGFVDRKGYLGKLETPARVLLSEIDKAMAESVTGQDNQTYLKILDRLEKRISDNMKSVSNELSIIISGLRKKIVVKGTEISNLLGDKNLDFENEIKAVESFVEKEVQKSRKEFITILDEKSKELTEDIKKIFESDLGQMYLEYIPIKNVEIDNPNLKDNSELVSNFKAIDEMVSTVTDGVINLAGGRNVSGFMKATDITGSKAHQVVYKGGKLLKVKFKPWQAVNISKKLANISKVVGPVLQLIASVLDIKQIFDDEKNSKKLVKAKSDCYEGFREIAEDIEMSFRKQFKEYKDNEYLPVLKKIEKKRQETIQAQNNDSAFCVKMTSFKEELHTLIGQIYNNS